MHLTLSDKYHLYKRACFFEHHDKISNKEDAFDVVEIIFNQQKPRLLHLDLPEWNEQLAKKSQGKNGKKIRVQWRQDVKDLNQQWILNMLKPDAGLIEKMTLFWHGHFACRTVTNPYGTINYNNLLRNNALGNFRTLLLKVSQSFSMMNYLHLKQNKKGHPNEDFARELCELFTLGRDVDYNESDVKEIARAFTGWSFDGYGKFFLNTKQHDYGSKTIFGQTGNFGGEEVLDLILENKNTARFISKKIYQFFVREKVDPVHVEELASVFYDQNYEISALMKHLFTQKWFYESKGEIIPGSIEYIVRLGKMFNLKYEEQKTLLALQVYLGQTLFDPPNVAGWPGGRKWIDSSRMALRMRLGSLIINKGVIQEELTPELDAMIAQRSSKEQIKFYEQINWDKYFERNKNADFKHLLLAVENKELSAKLLHPEREDVIQIISTPDFQLT